MTSPSLSGRIGPSASFVPIKILSNPICWVAAAMALFSFVPAIRIALWSALSADPMLQRVLIGFHEFQKSLHFGPIALTVIGLIVTRALVWFSTSSYRIEGDFLYINNGILGMLGGGFFQSFTNTVARSLIIDCDITRNPVQLLFGCGTIWIKTADNLVTRLDLVSRPVTIRDALLNASAISKVRMIATV